MGIGLTAVLLLLLAGLVLVRWLAQRAAASKKNQPVNSGSTKKGRKTLKQRQASQWHAVRMQAGHDCCDSISYVQDKVFLAREAPTLPLPSCGQANCRCTYEHFSDRRQELRRDPYSQYGLMAAQHSGEERRGRSRGRREADLVSA